MEIKKTVIKPSFLKIKLFFKKEDHHSHHLYHHVAGAFEL